MRWTLHSLALVLALTAPALSSSRSGVFAGAWLLSTEDDRHLCNVLLTDKKVAQGYGIHFKTGCDDHFPIQSVVAWKPYGEMIVFISEGGTPILTFQETEDGSEDGIYNTGGDPDYFLQDERDNKERLSKAKADPTGRWSLGREEGTVECTVDLMPGPATLSGKIRLYPDCGSEWTRLGLKLWRFADHRIVFANVAGKPLRRYQQRDPNTFEDEDLARPRGVPFALWRRPNSSR